MTDRDWDLALNGFSPLTDIKAPPFSEKDLEKQREAMDNSSSKEKLYNLEGLEPEYFKPLF